MPVVNREGGMKRWGELLTERGNNVCFAKSPPIPPSNENPDWHGRDCYSSSSAKFNPFRIF